MWTLLWARHDQVSRICTTAHSHSCVAHVLRAPLPGREPGAGKVCCGGEGGSGAVDGRKDDGAAAAQQQPRLHLGDSVQVVRGDLAGLVGWVMVVPSWGGGADGDNGADSRIPKDTLAATSDITGCGCRDVCVETQGQGVRDIEAGGDGGENEGVGEARDAHRCVTGDYGEERPVNRHQGGGGVGRSGYVCVCIPGVPGGVRAWGEHVDGTAEEIAAGGGGGRRRRGRRGHWLPQAFLSRVCGRR